MDRFMDPPADPERTPRAMAMLTSSLRSPPSHSTAVALQRPQNGRHQSLDGNRPTVGRMGDDDARDFPPAHRMTPVLRRQSTIPPGDGRARSCLRDLDRGALFNLQVPTGAPAVACAQDSTVELHAPPRRMEASCGPLCLVLGLALALPSPAADQDATGGVRGRLHSAITDRDANAHVSSAPIQHDSTQLPCSHLRYSLRRYHD